MLHKKLRILLYGSGFWALGEGMLGPLFAVFAQQLGGSILDISWAWAIYLIVTGVLVLLTGRLADKKKLREELMIIGYALNAILTFCYLFVSSATQLFIIQLGLGVAASLTIPTWNAIYSKHVDEETGGYLWGLASGSPAIITGVAVIIGGFIVSYFSFTALFITMGTIQVIAAIYQAQILSKH